MDKNKKALLEYQRECINTGISARKAMIKCIDNGWFEHVNMFLASKVINKVFEKTVLKTKH